MGEPDKLGRVKESLGVLRETAHPQDFLSLVAFGDRAEVVFPSTRMGEPGAKESFARAAAALVSAGTSNLRAGLEAGSGSRKHDAWSNRSVPRASRHRRSATDRTST